ncbi:MAG: ribosome silencing factor [Candidatus Goldbacteria bacterium]|nr:ribosome silencing factor [Candidatus Goldiibacteriota bacterium]
MKKKVTSSDKLKRLIKLLEEKKAQDIVILDTRKQSDIWNNFIICSAMSSIHIKALKNYILTEMKKYDYLPVHSEGEFDSNWVVIDYDDVLLHIFDEKTRKYYSLEKLWGESETKVIKKQKKVAKNERTKKNKN